jgi:anthranilate phosphoribosyltransferase
MIRTAIAKLSSFEHLSAEEASAVMREILGGRVTGAQTGALLLGLQMKGASVGELVVCASVMREHAARFRPHVPGTLVDTCGTGGDHAGTFNISTAAALVAAGGGAFLVKHGNRGVTSRCGSADVLEALGVVIDPSPEDAERLLRSTGFCFLFARRYHPAMRHAAPVRAEIGIRTVFNLLGPLTNPAGADAQLLGVYDTALIRPLAEVLGRLGTGRGMVVHGDGLDEITTAGTGVTAVAEITGGTVREYRISCEDFGIPRVSMDDLRGGDPGVNRTIIREILDGERGAPRDVTALNAAAALCLAGRTSTLAGGLERAYASIDAGRAGAVLDALTAGSGGG